MGKNHPENFNESALSDETKFNNQYRIKSTRLPYWDYRWNACYFVTICTIDHEPFFGDVINEKMHLSKIGEIAETCWRAIPQHFSFVELGEHIVMPNHLHGIIIIQNDDHDIKQNEIKNVRPISLQEGYGGVSKNEIKKFMSSISPKKGSLSAIIRSYKSAVTRESRLLRSDFTWQSRFYDHIIRDDVSFQRISEYIIANPLKWGRGQFYYPV